MHRIFLSLVASFSASAAVAEPSIESLGFLEGAWRSDADGFVFEEVWYAPAGGVMTGMARGVSGDALRVLEYLVIAEENDGVVMRFKHFNADYSNWEGEDTPLELTLTHVDGEDATFTADPPTHSVAAIRYRLTAPRRLEVDVVQVADGETGGFTLSLRKLE